MQINNVTFSYDKKINRLKSVNSEIEMGKITTIIGPNGCGKSTLLSMMSRNNNPLEGTVLVDGKNILKYKPKEFARKVAIVHQKNEAPSDLTVEKLTSYGRLPYKNWFKRDETEDNDAIEWALTCTNLLDKRDKLIGSLSGGEQQRVWIAMALAQKTPILLLDEPTTYLDLYYQMEILELVKYLNEAYGLTIVMILHDINQAIRYSDNIIAMKEGEVVLQGNTKDVISKEIIKEIYGIEVFEHSSEKTGLFMVPLGI